MRFATARDTLPPEAKLAACIFVHFEQSTEEQRTEALRRISTFCETAQMHNFPDDDTTFVEDIYIVQLPEPVDFKTQSFYERVLRAKVRAVLDEVLYPDSQYPWYS